MDREEMVLKAMKQTPLSPNFLIGKTRLWKQIENSALETFFLIVPLLKNKMLDRLGFRRSPKGFCRPPRQSWRPLRLSWRPPRLGRCQDQLGRGGRDAQASQFNGCLAICFDEKNGCLETISSTVSLGFVA